MKNILSDIVKTMSQFDTIEYIVLDKTNGGILATGIDSNKGMVVKGEFPEQPDFENNICLGQLKFLRRVLDQEQIQNSDGQVQFDGKEEFEENSYYKDITFKGPRFKVTYNAVGPKTIKSKNKKLYPTIKEIDVDLSVVIESTICEEFKQASALQKMMVNTKEDCVVQILVEDENLVMRFPYSSQKIDLIIEEGVEFSLNKDMLFDVSKIEKAMNVILSNENGKLDIAKNCIDFSTISEEGVYTVRLPKLNTVKRL